MKYSILAVLAIAGCTSITAADGISGQWTLKMDPDFKGNPGQLVDCTFKQVGAELTIKCGTGIEIKGTVRGRKVIWGFEKTGIPPMVEDRMVVRYDGDVSESGTALKGTWRVTSGVMDMKGNFEAKKRQ